MKKSVCIALVVIVVSGLFSLAGCDENAVKNTFYDIRCEYFDTGVVTFDEQVTFTSPCDGLNEAVFNVYALNSAKKGEGFDGGEYGCVRFLAVTAGGGEAGYTVSDESVKIRLKKTYSSGEKVNVRLKMAVTLPYGDDRYSLTDGTVNLGNVFPTLAVYDGEKFVFTKSVGYGDPFFTDVADYHVEMTLPSTFVAAASAYPRSLDVGEDKTRYIYDIKGVRDFAFALSNKYNVKSEKWGDKSINYYYYADDTPEETVLTAVKCLEYFSDAFGAYPYDVYSIAQTAFSAGGMEYPLLCYLNDKLSKKDYLYALVHETAHQWWYAVVGNDQISESYLDESLAEYSTYLFFDEHTEYGINGNDVIKGALSAANVCENAVLANDKDFIPAVKGTLESFKSEYIYVNMVYNKGLIMMRSAEKAVGRNKIKNALKKYYAKNAFKKADTEEFLSCMGEAAPVVRSFLDGKTRVFI